MRDEETQIQKQKRLLLMNLNKANQLFKTRYPTLQIGILKFCETRPRNVLLLGPECASEW